MPDFIQHCGVCCNAEKDSAIVAAKFNHGGPIAEIPGGAVAVPYSDQSGLDRAIRDALGACIYELEYNYKDSKPSDWPSFQESGYKTIRKFEADYVCLRIRGTNARNIHFLLESPSFGMNSLRLASTVNPGASDFGSAVHQIYEQFLKLRSQV
ncbi:MAG: hypothetical protein QNJ05_06860 [Woeseiaceae bacterium]|nr:hypothetical protein [Woeseiaceae bacterium]